MDTNIVTERIRLLRKMHNLSARQLSQKTGLALSALTQMDRGKYTPGLKTLVTLADFFNVSIDYLLGRVDMDTKLYKKEIKELYTNSYERYLMKRREGTDLYGMGIITAEPLATWPYNLLEYAGLDEHIEFPLNDIQLEGLEYVIDNMLQPREAAFLCAYFEREMTLDEVGKQFDLTRERVRQIIAKAVRKIRHSSRANIIKYGVDYFTTKDEFQRLKRMEEFIESAEAEKIQTMYEELKTDENAKVYVSLNDLNLSVRSYNCIVRTLGKSGDEISLEDIASLFTSGAICYMRNAGRKSVNEIRDALLSHGYSNKDLAVPSELSLDDAWVISYDKNRIRYVRRRSA